jgi:Protein of unknown function (DUF3168)
MWASLALQRQLVAVLSADAALAARGLKLFDGPPADARPPYLTVGADAVSDWGFKGGEGRVHRFSVTLWDARESLAGAKEIMGEVEAAVMAMPRSFAEVRLVQLRLLRAQVKRSARGWTQGMIEFRALSVVE